MNIHLIVLLWCQVGVVNLC